MNKTVTRNETKRFIMSLIRVLNFLKKIEPELYKEAEIRVRIYDGEE